MEDLYVYFFYFVLTYSKISKFKVQKAKLRKQFYFLGLGFRISDLEFIN